MFTIVERFALKFKGYLKDRSFARNFSSYRSPFYPVVFAGLAVLFLWPLVLHPDFVPVRHGDQLSDLVQFSAPLYAYIRESLAQYGQLPLWNARILAGMPLAADPNSGLWYPPHWLLFLPWLPLPVAFNLLYLLHFALAGYGLFRLLSAEAIDPGPAFLGGVVFMGTSKLMAHVGAGHSLMVEAVAWTPWFLLAVKRAAALGGLKRGALMGSLLALMFLAFAPWAFYAVMFGAALAVAEWVRQRRMGLAAPFQALLKAGLTGAGVFLALTAILTVPLVELAYFSSRSALTLAEAEAYSLPPYPYLLGLFVPFRGILHEWTVYVGLAPLGLAVLSLRRRSFFWWGVVLFALAFSLGQNFFLFPLLFRLIPGLSFLREPPRVWFMGALGISCLAAQGLPVLFDAARAAGARLATTRLAGLQRIVSDTRLLFLVLLLGVTIDLLSMNSSLVTMRPLPTSVPIAEWIASQPGLFRVYSPTNSLPPPDVLQHVEGYNPLHLAATADFVARASGIPNAHYSTSVPALWVEDANAPPALVQMVSSPDARLLGLLNVKYVAMAFPLNAPGLVLTRTFESAYVYENLLFRPRAWTEKGDAAILKWSPNRLTLQAMGPGLLTLSEVAYPGWEVRVDGEKATVETVEGILRGVHLPAGVHEVVFDYRPQTLYLGAGITLAGLALLAAIWRWGR